jgi:hypothetical protein
MEGEGVEIVITFLALKEDDFLGDGIERYKCCSLYHSTSTASRVIYHLCRLVLMALVGVTDGTASELRRGAAKRDVRGCGGMQSSESGRDGGWALHAAASRMG